MTAEKFPVGTRVHVEFDGVVESSSGAGFPDYRLGNTVRVKDDLHGWYHDVCILGSAIERATPQNWPPKRGEVWAAKGKRWFAWGDDGAKVAHGLKSMDGSVLGLDAFLAEYPAAERILAA